jgi:hypothetical protein
MRNMREKMQRLLLVSFLSLSLVGCFNADPQTRRLNQIPDLSGPIVFSRHTDSGKTQVFSVFGVNSSGVVNRIYEEELENSATLVWVPFWVSGGKAIAISREPELPLLLSGDKVFECPSLLGDYPDAISSRIIDTSESDDTVYLQILQHYPVLGPVIKANLRTCSVETVTDTNWIQKQFAVISICEAKDLWLVSQAEGDYTPRVLKDGRVLFEVPTTERVQFYNSCDNIIGIRADGFYSHTITDSAISAGTKIFSKDFTGSMSNSASSDGPFVNSIDISPNNEYLVYAYSDAQKSVFLVNLAAQTEGLLVDDGYYPDWSWP